MLITRLPKHDHIEKRTEMYELLDTFAEKYTVHYKPNRMIHIEVEHEDEIKEVFEMQGFTISIRS